MWSKDHLITVLKDHYLVCITETYQEFLKHIDLSNHVDVEGNFFTILTAQCLEADKQCLEAILNVAKNDMKSDRTTKYGWLKCQNAKVQRPRKGDHTFNFERAKDQIFLTMKWNDRIVGKLKDQMCKVTQKERENQRTKCEKDSIHTSKDQCGRRTIWSRYRRTSI